MEVPNWDDYFMTMVYLVASKSKDENTHLGAIVVDKNNLVRTLGYNSFPRGINDYVPERQQRPEKYFWFEHAERNAIYNATLTGVSLKDCILYTNGIPCMDCGRAVVQAGIKEVIVDNTWENKLQKNGKSTHQKPEKCLKKLELILGNGKGILWIFFVLEEER